MKLRKLTAIALCAVMILSLLSGCQKPMDAQTLVQKMNEAIAGRNASSMTSTMDLDMTLSVEGTSMDMSIHADITTKQNETNHFTDMDMELKMLGITQKVGTETYAFLEDGKYISYVYTDLDDSWTRMELEGLEMTSGAEASAYAFLADAAPEELVLDEEKQTLNEREVYVLRATMRGDQMKESFTASFESMGAGFDEMTAGILENLDFSAVSIPTVFYIDAETFLPVKMEMEMLGMGDMMMSLINAVMSTMSGDLDMDETEFTVEIPTCTLVSEDIRFDSVEVPSVPQEGIDAAAANPLQADGSYLLHSDSDWVRIELPEGFTAVDYDENYLMFVNEDYTVYGEYSLLYNTEEEILTYIDSEEQYATEEEYFVSRSDVAQVGDYSTVLITYTEGMTDYYAWKQLDGCLLDVMVSVMDPSAAASLDVLLECAEVQSIG